jgi:hypothetical protein
MKHYKLTVQAIQYKQTVKAIQNTWTQVLLHIVVSRCHTSNVTGTTSKPLPCSTAGNCDTNSLTSTTILFALICRPASPPARRVRALPVFSRSPPDTSCCVRATSLDGFAWTVSWPDCVHHT